MSITELKIGDSAGLFDGGHYEIIGLPGVSRAFPQDYKGKKQDGNHVIFSMSEVISVNGVPLNQGRPASSYLQRPGEYPAEAVEAAYLHITESKQMAGFFDELDELCGSYGVDYDRLLTYMEKNPNKVLLP